MQIKYSKKKKTELTITKCILICGDFKISMSLFIPFGKMHALGNSIIVLDMREQTHSLSKEFVTQINKKLPFDQIMVLYSSNKKDIPLLKIINKDRLYYPYLLFYLS